MKIRTASTPFPPLRKAVFKNCLMIVLLYGGMGIFMILAVFSASGVTPRLIHLNYDSISAANRMKDWIVSYDITENSIQKMNEFENDLAFEESNITEPGEEEKVRNLRILWNQLVRKESALKDLRFRKAITEALDQIIEVNEKGMFNLASETTRFSRGVLLAAFFIFTVSLFFSLYLADGFAVQIANPLKEFAEVLRKKPIPGLELKLPEPTTLEMRILTHEMLRLWDRLSTLKKLNVDELENQGRKLESILASVEDVVLVLDHDEKVIFCDPGMLKLVQMDCSSIVRSVWKDLSTASENYLKLRSFLLPELKGEQTISLVVDNQVRVFSGRCRFFSSGPQSQVGYLYLLHDITDVRQKDRIRMEFFASLSEDLRLPLQNLREVVKNLEKDEKLVLQENVARVSEIANEFSRLSLAESCQVVSVERVSLKQIVEHCIEPFQVLAKDRNVQIQFFQQGSENIFAEVDPVKFPWAVSNLLSNAIRVSAPGSQVSVLMTDREKRIDLEVQDEGPGISVMNNFVGLRFAITKQVVEAHQGNIEYFQKKPQGSIFRISLPFVS